VTVRRLVVVGGGLAGLAAAWTAHRLGGDIPGGLEVVLLERHREVGGKIRTLTENGWLVEAGPSGFLSGRPELTRLIEDAGLAPAILPANAEAGHRFLLRDGRLREIPTHPMRFARSGLLTVPGLIRMLGELLIPTRHEDGEETVWAFAARRLGRQVADRLVAPMALGVFAGDAHRLSLPAAFPRMAALEREHGSLLKALVARRGRMGTGTLTSFRGGLQQLPRALAARAGFRVHCGAEVNGLRHDSGQWRITLAGEREALPADAVILATEPGAMATLLEPLSSRAADDLRSIPCPPVSVVALGYPADSCQGVPHGFGVLIGRDQGYRMLGNLWDTHLFPGRSPPGCVLIRVLLGGAVDREIGDLDDASVVALAVAEVARLYGIVSPPSFHRIVRWERAIPQYETGHRERVARIEAAVARFPGLAVAGAGLHGVSLPDVAASGVQVAERAVRTIDG